MAYFEDFTGWLDDTLEGIEGAFGPLMERWQSWDAIIHPADAGGDSSQQQPPVFTQPAAPANNTNLILLGFAGVALLILVTR